jgi:hypothetical protein
VEIGDSYAANRSYQVPDTKFKDVANNSPMRVPRGLKPKDLIGQPFLLAFALRDDGWYLRGCYVWHRPNPMPESVRDRFTTSHSYLLHFSKRPRYFFDAEAVKEENADPVWTVNALDNPAWIRRSDSKTDRSRQDGDRMAAGKRHTLANQVGRNRRSVLTIPTEPNGLAICAVCDAYWERGAPREHCEKPVIQHFAAFPAKLVEIPILAGTSEHGVCAECGAPWVREVSVENFNMQASPKAASGGLGVRAVPTRADQVTTTLGWSPSCTCKAGVRPAVVLDPFSGSGTTLLVARRLGRHAVGIELNRDYCRMQRERLRQLSLLGAA